MVSCTCSIREYIQTVVSRVLSAYHFIHTWMSLTKHRLSTSCMQLHSALIQFNMSALSPPILIFCINFIAIHSWLHCKSNVRATLVTLGVTLLQVESHVVLGQTTQVILVDSAEHEGHYHCTVFSSSQPRPARISIEHLYSTLHI